MARRQIVEGKPYRVVESLGFDHSCGYRAIVVDADGVEKVAVKVGPIWRFWGWKDRIQPPRVAVGMEAADDNG